MKDQERTTFIDVGQIENGRPKDRPPKNNWKINLIKKGVIAIQHISPKIASEVIWHHFTKPGRSKFTNEQKVLLDKATISSISYFGHEIYTYRWGTTGPKILLCHGWRSKIADFRRMIESLVEAGYVVEGIDMKAHGQSEGKHTALPEMRDILKSYYVKNGPYYAVIGYSIGGMVAGITLSELSQVLLPKKLFILSAPPYVRYFFYDTVKEVGCSDSVYESMCGLVNKNYHQPVDYFDLRKKKNDLEGIDIHLIYDEDDQMVTLDRGKEIWNSFPEASFVHTKGLGHYKIISHREIIDYIQRKLVSKNSLIQV